MAIGFTRNWGPSVCRLTSTELGEDWTNYFWNENEKKKPSVLVVIYIYQWLFYPLRADTHTHTDTYYWLKHPLHLLKWPDSAKYCFYTKFNRLPQCSSPFTSEIRCMIYCSVERFAPPKCDSHTRIHSQLIKREHCIRNDSNWLSTVHQWLLAFCY